MTLEGRTALVTGASRGIGSAIAKYLAQAGAAVAVCARTEEQQNDRLPGTIHSVAQEINDAGGRAVGIRMDMRDIESIQAGVKRTEQELGPPDILVNNAAVQFPGTINGFEPRHLELMWGVNLRGPIMLMSLVLPHMRAAGIGHIINVSSRGAVFPGPGPYVGGSQQQGIVRGSFYGALKAALERFSQAVAQEVQSENISVNVLSPEGGVRTPGLLYFTQRDVPVDELEFQEATELGKAAVWICEQPPQQFTGNILYDQSLCREHGL